MLVTRVNQFGQLGRVETKPPPHPIFAAVGGGYPLGVDVDAVGLKATTLERLGALGRGEGIAAVAVVLIQRF